MVRRARIKYTKEITSKILDRYQHGESLKAIAGFLDTQSSSIYSQLVPTGCIRPPKRKRSQLSLTLADRNEISRGIAGNLSAQCSFWWFISIAGMLPPTYRLNDRGTPRSFLYTLIPRSILLRLVFSR